MITNKCYQTVIYVLARPMCLSTFSSSSALTKSYFLVRKPYNMPSYAKIRLNIKYVKVIGLRQEVYVFAGVYLFVSLCAT